MFSLNAAYQQVNEMLQSSYCRENMGGQSHPRWAHITNNAITYLITGENATVPR